MIKHDTNKITATMRLVVTGEFYDDEASEETIRYCVEQDLEDAGFDVDVSLLKEQEPLAVYEDKTNKCVCGNGIKRYWHPEYCGFCGKKLLWY